jgi:hypothetical protein
MLPVFASDELIARRVSNSALRVSAAEVRALRCQRRRPR